MASGRASNPQTWNRYAYTLNNPLRFIDPYGLEEQPCATPDQECAKRQQASRGKGRYVVTAGIDAVVPVSSDDPSWWSRVRSYLITDKIKISPAKPPGAPKWKYSQTTGQMSTDILGTETKVGQPGYAGHNEGLNNPANQAVAEDKSDPDSDNAGPLPQGMYFIGKQRDHGTLKASERLTPEPGTEMFGRDSFLIHGSHDPSTQDSSQGCPVLGPAVRNAIGNCGFIELEVVP